MHGDRVPKITTNGSGTGQVQRPDCLDQARRLIEMEELIVSPPLGNTLAATRRKLDEQAVM